MLNSRNPDLAAATSVSPPLVKVNVSFESFESYGSPSLIKKRKYYVCTSVDSEKMASSSHTGSMRRVLSG